MSQNIPVRKMNFQFSDVPRDFINGNLAYSNVFNGMNLLFPEGERFFMHAVRDGLKHIDDPELAAEAKGFFGQEAQHSLEHEKYFEILDQQGYQFREELGRFDRLIIKLRKKLPTGLRLAMTAGAEHLTAIMGQTSLLDEDIKQAHPVMRDLLQWHAIEEIEHKAVAFDVFQQAYGKGPIKSISGYCLRILGYIIAIGLVGGYAYKFARMFMRQEGLDKKAAHQQLNACYKLLNQRHSYLSGYFFQYLKPGFHPNDIDDEHLLSQAMVDLTQAG